MVKRLRKILGTRTPSSGRSPRLQGTATSRKPQPSTTGPTNTAFPASTRITSRKTSQRPPAPGWSRTKRVREWTLPARPSILAASPCTTGAWRLGWRLLCSSAAAALSPQRASECPFPTGRPPTATTCFSFRSRAGSAGFFMNTSTGSSPRGSA